CRVAVAAAISATQNPNTTRPSSCRDDQLRSAPLIMTSRSPLTAYVSGKTLEITCIHSSSDVTGTITPLRSTCGTTTSGMNCTAWNSVRENVLRKIPRLTAASTISSSIRKIRSTLPELWILSTYRENSSTIAACSNATTVKPSM